MAGRAIRVIPRQALDYTYLGKGKSETRVVVGRIPSVAYTTGSLLVRVHNISVGGGQADGQLTVSVVQDASTDEDPANAFLGSAAIAGASIDITASDGAGALKTSSITGDLGSMVAVKLLATQDSAAAGALLFDISVDLIMKSS